MADITMCANEGCPRRKQCYRATATPGVMQSWCEFPVKDYAKCEYFIADDDADQEGKE